MNYTNNGLVQHVKKAVKLNTKYMWGGILRTITAAYIAQLSSIPTYKPQYPNSRVTALKAVIGKGFFGCDCVGLIKSYYWSGNALGGTGSKYYDGDTDYNAGTMYSAAKVKGPISTLPEIPGLILYCRSHPHVGVYIGGGKVIESTLSSRGDGIVETKLSDFGWEYWFQCPFIAAESVETFTAKTLKYKASVRALPNASAKRYQIYPKGTIVKVIPNSDTKDTSSGFVYVKIKYGTNYAWIVKTSF